MFKLPRIPRYLRALSIASLLGIFCITTLLTLFREDPKPYITDVSQESLNISQRPGSFVADMPQSSLDMSYLQRWLSLLKTNHVPFHPSYGISARRLDFRGFSGKDKFHWAMYQPFIEKISRMGEERHLWPALANTDVVWEEETWVTTTGILNAEWERSLGPMREGEKKATGNAVNQDPEDPSMNIKGNKGRVTLKFEEDKGVEMQFEETFKVCESEELGFYCWHESHYQEALAREITAIMTVQDESTSGTGWEVRIHGVHWPRVGLLIMTTTSEKFAGIFGLPFLIFPDSSLYWCTTSRKLLSASIQKVLEKLKGATKVGEKNPWTAWLDSMIDPKSPEPQCEYVLYVLLNPAASGSGDGKARKPEAVVGTEMELGNQKAQMSLAILSPNCGIFLKSRDE